jgi:signal transduction histidine kinase
VFCAVAETTGSVIGARRLAALRDVGADTAAARSAREVCELAASAMDAHRADLPYGLVYLAAGSRAGMVASWGLPTPVPPDYAQIELADPAAALPLGQAQATRMALTVERPQGLPTPAVVVLPACPSGDAGPPAFLVAGVSPLRELDDAYRSFLDVLARQLTAAVAAAHAYESAQQRAQALAELDRAKTEFFSNISHEFRTPLTLITGPVAELRTAPGLAADSRLREELEVIHRNGLRLGKLVNTLLEFSRIQAGRIQAHYEPLDLGAFTVELASVFRSAIERAGLRLEIDRADFGQPVFVDREMWGKVVLNLLSNALKFTFDGHITVAVRRSGDSAVVTVADTGTGIPAEELPRLFDRFHRIRGAHARSHEGSGIGLALVAELVALHGGSIAVDSTPGVGTAFALTLPLGSAHLPADQIVPPSTVTGPARAWPRLWPRRCGGYPAPRTYPATPTSPPAGGWPAAGRRGGAGPGRGAGAGRR